MVNYSISSLMNMERLLYGGSSLYSNAPNFGNNYQMPLNNYYPSFYGNPSFGTNFGQQLPQYYTNALQNYNYPQSQQIQTQQMQQKPGDAQPSQNQASQTIFGCLSQEQKQGVVDFYAKNLDPAESFKNAVLLGGASMALTQNPRIFVHPINYIKTSLKSSDVNKMFNGVRENGSIMNKLWKENSTVLEEAFSQMHRVEARSKKRYTNLIRKRFTTEEYGKLKKIMEDALENAKRTGNIDEVAKATETLRHAYCNNGWIARGVNKVTKLFGWETLPKIDKKLAETNVINEAAQRLINCNNKNMNLKRAFIKSGGWFGAAMGLIEIAFNWNKVKTAEARDAENAKKGIHTELGKQQKRQTITKGIANTIGWAVGETAAIWAFAKAGAAVGTAFGPGIGTLVGATIGYIGGSLGMWLAGLATKATLGEDVANKIEAENKVQTQEGQLELIQAAQEAMAKGQSINPFAQQAVNQVLTTYA